MPVVKCIVCNKGYLKELYRFLPKFRSDGRCVSCIISPEALKEDQFEFEGLQRLVTTSEGPEKIEIERVETMLAGLTHSNPL
jgi:hypothetical protein